MLPDRRESREIEFVRTYDTQERERVRRASEEAAEVEKNREKEDRGERKRGVKTGETVRRSRGEGKGVYSNDRQNTIRVTLRTVIVGSAMTGLLLISSEK